MGSFIEEGDYNVIGGADREDYASMQERVVVGETKSTMIVDNNVSKNVVDKSIEGVNFRLGELETTTTTTTTTTSTTESTTETTTTMSDDGIPNSTTYNFGSPHVMCASLFIMKLVM